MSRIDVVVPCYNYGRFLRECVESILSQPVDVRVLIINDASTDNTEEVAQELMAQDHRVEYRRHPVNQGHISTMNEGLEWVSAEYHALLSADDLMVPGALARAIRLLDAEPSVGLVHGKDIQFQSSDSKPLPRTTSEHCSWKIIKGLEFIEESCSKGLNLAQAPTVTTRTALLKQAGFFRPDLPHAGDMAMWLNYAAYSDVGVLDAEQAYYRVHSQSMYHTQFKSYLVNARQRIAAFEALFRDAGHRLSNVEVLRCKAQLKANALHALRQANWEFTKGEVDQCREELKFAVSCWPDAVHEKIYRRVKIKLWFGPSVWNIIRRLTFRAQDSR